MKNLILTFLILTLGSCGAIKSVNRAKSTTSTTETTNSKEKIVNLQTYARSITLTDSAEYRYKIVIYPVDTFLFSIQQGFKGKAGKVELIGLTNQSHRKTDTIAITTLTDHQKQFNSVKTATTKAAAVAKTIKRNKSHWLLTLCLALAVSIGIVWVIRKLRR